MLGIDVGDDGIGAVEPQEAAVALVGLHHHPVGRAEPCVGAVAVDDAAVDDGRVHAAGIEDRGDHRGGRRLAVRARHRDGGFQAHQLGQHLGAADDGDAAFQRQLHLRIAALDRGGGDHHGRIAQIFRLVADRDGNAALAQALDHIAFGHVRALHLVAEVVHHLGDARHADPADADEMDGPDIGGDALHANTPLGAGSKPGAV